jgi:thiamine pyrophosphokinase
LLYTLVFANGDLNDGPAVQAALGVMEPRLVIAADGGSLLAQQLGITPDVVIGDMDSTSEQQLAEFQAKGAEIIHFPVAKDETDLELALLEATKRGGKAIRILGATGGRLDQTLANIYLLALPALQDCDMQLVSERQRVWLAHAGLTTITGAKGDTVSLIPLSGEAVGIRTENMEYPLRGETLTFGPARGVSNVMLANEASFTFERGLLLVIHTIGRA